jgi:hypothetical protein
MMNPSFSTIESKGHVHAKKYEAMRVHNIREVKECTGLKIEIPENIIEILALSIRPEGCMFVDYDANDIPASIRDTFTEINDECMNKIRYFESQRSMRFGYNEISIFQPNSGKNKSF